MAWKKDNEIYNGKSIVHNGYRIFNPGEKVLKEAGYEWVEPTPVEPTAEQVLRQYEDRVQRFLDETAQSRGYDNTYTCLSYLNSTDQTWNTEANAFNAWRDQVWRKCHETFNAFMSGAIERPTAEELIASFPALDWGTEPSGLTL